MTKSKLIPIAALLTSVWLAATILPAGAQQPPASAPPAGGPPQGGPPQGQSEGPPWPVVRVVSVEVLRSEKSGGMDLLRVMGQTTSGNWGSPHLIPITLGKPIDGVLDVLMMATAPQSPAPLGNPMTVEAVLPIFHGHPYTAVRVRSATNAITLKTLPGFAEQPAPKNDCSKCLGKYFVAKGATPPAGVAADNIVRQEDLPWELRVIGPTQGIPAYAVDPNRLTLVLGEDGRIVDGAWD